MAGFEESWEREGGLAKRAGWIARACTRLRDTLEAETDRGFLWLPVLFRRRHPSLFRPSE